MLEQARAKGFSGVDYLCAPVEDIPLPDASCQAVICYSAFPHFADQRRAVAEMARVLAAGGRLVIAHAESREAINSLHAGMDGPVVSHKLPENAVMRSYLRSAGLQEVNFRDGPQGYLVVARRPVSPT